MGLTHNATRYARSCRITPTGALRASGKTYLLLCLALSAAACSEEPVGLTTPIAEVAREAGDNRITTDPETFASLLEQVSARRRVLILVRSSSLPPISRMAALSEPSWNSLIMFLPAVSDTASNERALGVESRRWSANDASNMGLLLQMLGAREVQVMPALGIVTADLARDRQALVGMLSAIGNHSSLDTLEPAQDGSGAFDP